MDPISPWKSSVLDHSGYRSLEVLRLPIPLNNPGNFTNPVLPAMSSVLACPTDVLDQESTGRRVGKILWWGGTREAPGQLDREQLENAGARVNWTYYPS